MRDDADESTMKGGPEIPFEDEILTVLYQHQAKRLTGDAKKRARFGVPTILFKR
jgi:hypothetical protein